MSRPTDYTDAERFSEGLRGYSAQAVDLDSLTLDTILMDDVQAIRTVRGIRNEAKRHTARKQSATRKLLTDIL